MVTPSGLGPYRVGDELADLSIGRLVQVTDPARPISLVAILLADTLARDIRFKGMLRLAVARAGGVRHPSRFCG